MSAIIIVSIILCGLLVGAASLIITDIIRGILHKKPLPAKKGCAVVAAVGAGTAALSFLLMSAVYYPAEPSAKTYLESGDTVTVTKEGCAYFFDGPGEEKAMIFYPGALVETEAYSQMMYMLAERGVDAFLVDMPFRLALFGDTRADKIIASHTYGEWYMSGHSLGGSVASEYCTETKNDIEGVVFLASYPFRKLESSVAACMIYGSDDTVLSADRYEKHRSLCSGRVDELRIEGGNHAQFGSYGEQPGDGKAEISSDEQKCIAVEEIIKFVSE